eukprot:m.52100 g.52100  ORF g.52100 m.52100 type:complete len:84 (+) comp10984_c0_seq6:496-747(+)
MNAGFTEFIICYIQLFCGVNWMWKYGAALQTGEYFIPPSALLGSSPMKGLLNHRHDHELRQPPFPFVALVHVQHLPEVVGDIG